VRTEGKRQTQADIEKAYSTATNCEKGIDLVSGGWYMVEGTVKKERQGVKSSMFTNGDCQ